MNNKQYQIKYLQYKYNPIVTMSYKKFQHTILLTKKESSYPKLVANSVATEAVTRAIVSLSQSFFGLSGWFSGR